jgi:hypothetical protein
MASKVFQQVILKDGDGNFNFKHVNFDIHSYT